MKRKASMVGTILLGSGFIAGISILFYNLLITKNKTIKENNITVSPKRFEIGFQIMSKWLKLKNDGKNLSSYFKDNEISTIAIYGMGALGERLYEELSKSDIKVVYAIDRIADKKSFDDLKIIGTDDLLDEVDAIIVTPVQDYYSIEETLEKKTDASIISLEDVVNYCC